MWEAIKSPLIEQAMTEDIELYTSFIPAEICSIEGGNRLFQDCLRRFRRRKKTEPHKRMHAEVFPHVLDRERDRRIIKHI